MTDPLTVTGAVERNISRNFSTLTPNASDVSRILRASSCCISDSFSRTLSIFFFRLLHARGASSSCFSTSSLTEMPYVLRRATVATRGSNMTSVLSCRLRTSRMKPITSYRVSSFSCAADFLTGFVPSAPSPSAPSPSAPASAAPPAPSSAPPTAPSSPPSAGAASAVGSFSSTRSPSA